MKVSVRWLRDYATLDAPVSTLVRALNDSGTEVSEVNDEGEGLLVARVVNLEPVPRAQNLQFADIDIGALIPLSLAQLGVQTLPLRLLTGARNLQRGDLVPYAPPGSRPPALEEPLSVKVIRGHKSPGMLCSAVELGVGDDAAGIMVLEHGVPGQPLREVLELDSVLDLEVPTNRPDNLCHVGIARELAAVLGEPLVEPAASIPEDHESATAAELRSTLRVDDSEGCVRFALRVIEEVTVRESPEWMRRRLRAIGLRPINAIVDVTNYVAHELGQPLHAFDLDKFIAAGGGDRAQVVVRRGRRGEKLVCLDGVERELGLSDVVVSAGERAASLAGVIGGADTAVDSSTRRVLLEAATWDGPTIRTTSRRLGLRTDASSLFEKGLSDSLPPVALERASALLVDVAGGHVLRGVVEERPRPQPEQAPITVTADFLTGLLGWLVDASEAATALAHLGFAVEQDGAILQALPPHFRRDVSIPEDVAEEVGRMLGYSRAPSTLPGRRQPVRTLATHASLEEAVRDVCTGAGFDEAITFSFISSKAARLVSGLGGDRRTIRLRNPLSEDWTVLRTSQLPGLCGALAANVNRGVERPAVFELGRVYWEGERTDPVPGSTPDGADQGLPPLPLEPLMLSVALRLDSADPSASAAELRRVQSLFGRICSDLGGVHLDYEPTSAASLRAGRAATAVSGGAAVGLIAELSAAALEELDVHGRVVVGELRLDGTLPAVPRRPRYMEPPRVPAVSRDLAVIVAEDRRAGEALTLIHESGGPLLESAELYDEYRGDTLEGGRKSWTFRLTFRALDRTLTNEEADRALAGVTAALTRALGAEPRR